MGSRKPLWTVRSPVWLGLDLFLFAVGLAAIIAGWNVLKVIREPTAAAFAYGSMLEG